MTTPQVKPIKIIRIMAAMKWWKVDVKRKGEPRQVYEIRTRSTKAAIIREERLKMPDVEYYYLDKLD